MRTKHAPEITLPMPCVKAILEKELSMVCRKMRVSGSRARATKLNSDYLKLKQLMEDCGF